MVNSPGGPAAAPAPSGGLDLNSSFEKSQPPAEQPASAAPGLGGGAVKRAKAMTPPPGSSPVGPGDSGV